MKHDYSLTPTSRDGRPRRPIEIAMTPMIDVIFLLLVFFLATSSFQLVEQMLPSSVSKVNESAGSDDMQPLDPTDDVLEQVIVKLALEQGTVSATMNGVDLVRLDALQNRLEAIGSTRADVPVIIDPAADVVAADFIRVYDWARQAGLARVFLSTRSTRLPAGP